MVGVAPQLHPKPSPALAAIYASEDPHLLSLVALFTDYLEIFPDSLAQTRGGLCPGVLDRIAATAPPLKFTAHGDSLSIASPEYWNESYLHLLDQLLERLTLEWHSEHLCTGARTEQTLDLICERVNIIQHRYQIPFLLEYTFQAWPDTTSTRTPAGFLNALTQRTNCEIVLAVSEFPCADTQAFLDELDPLPIRELHVADVCPISDILVRFPNVRLVTYDWTKSLTPPRNYESLCTNLSKIRKAVKPKNL